MATYIQTNQIILVPNAAGYAISAIDTGKIFILPQTTHYRVNGSAAIAAANVTLTATAAIMHGQLIQGPKNGVGLTALTGSTTITFVIGVVGPPASGSLKGDFVDLYSDGTLWYIQGASSRVGSMTVA